MADSSHIEPLLSILRASHGKEVRFGRSTRLFLFGREFSCSINFSKILRGRRFFFGLSGEVLDRNSELEKSQHGHFVVLICGDEESVLWLPRDLVLQQMEGVETGRLDIVLEEGAYLLQTTGHPKLDVTEFLNKAPSIQVRKPIPAPGIPDLGRTHSEIQLGLAKIGKAEGCTVWVPASDRGLYWKEESLKAYTCDSLPNFGFDENTRRVVANIDVLWLEGNIIRHAFEIEATTSVYSGMLRLNDLTLAQPNNRIDLCIVTDSSREPRVLGQIMRPTFRALSERCSFLSFAAVRDSVEEIERLKKRGIRRIEGLLTPKALRLPDRFTLDSADLRL